MLDPNPDTQIYHYKDTPKGRADRDQEAARWNNKHGYEVKKARDTTPTKPPLVLIVREQLGH